MIHRTHKRHVRTLDTQLAFKVAAHLAAGNTPFVFETISTTRSQQAYLSCHFEETLDAAIRLAEEATLRGASAAKPTLHVSK